MKRTMSVIALVVATFGVVVAAQQVLPRSANGGPANGGNAPAPVTVPRYPYAGAWDGSMTLEGASPAKLAMTFTVANGERQAYNGETTIDGRAIAHVNISSAPTADAPSAEGATIKRRTSGEAGPTGLADGSAPERDTLAAGDHALLLFHTPTRSMLLCDEGHRCVALASLTWEETGTDGARYAYTAKLISADTIQGTVAVTKAGRTTAGTFTLKRKN